MDQQDPKSSPTTVDENRRNLTKGGLAVPVVLASLASKNALAASAPYNCTISGKLSGNTSAHGQDQACNVGRTPGYWKTHTPWCIWNGAGQKFGGSSADGATLPQTFWYVTSGNQKNWVAPGTSGATEATLLEVIDPSFVNGDQGDAGKPYAELGRHVIAAVLNFYCLNLPFTYPIRPSEAIAMYTQVYNTGSYSPKPGVSWTGAQCTAYLKSLMD